MQRTLLVVFNELGQTVRRHRITPQSTLNILRFYKAKVKVGYMGGKLGVSQSRKMGDPYSYWRSLGPIQRRKYVRSH